MRSGYTSLLLAAIAFSAPAIGQQALAQSSPDSARSLAGAPVNAHVGREELTASLERLVPRLMKEGDVPGLSLAVVRDGGVLYQRAFGRKEASPSGAAVDDDTIFEAASLSKPVFAYAVLKLVDTGAIDLDTPVAKYLPGDYVNDARAGSITPRHVLSHTTGFPNWRSSRELTMHFAPGERFSYSGEGFVYLQKAVERVTGQTLDTVMKRLVFDPLAMSSSRYTWDPRFEGRKATGHDSTGNPRRLSRPVEASAAASLHTTALDYARFLIAVLDGTSLEKKTYTEMLRPQVHVDEGCQNCITSKPTGRVSRQIGWGLGWGIEETDDGEAIWHWGDNSSGFHCYAVGYPRQRLGVVIFANSLGGHGIIPDVVAKSIGGRHPSFAWLDYERYDSPARMFFKEILERGDAAIAAYRDRKRRGSEPLFTEQQVNRIGYSLLGRKRIKEAIAIFEMNVEDFPASWNVHDSLGEAYAENGERQKAIATYEKSLTLNPSNTNGLEQLRKLRSAAAQK